METKTLSDLSLYPVSSHRRPDLLFGDGHSEPWVTDIIWACQQCKVAITYFACLFEYMPEIFRLQ